MNILKSVYQDITKTKINDLLSHREYQYQAKILAQELGLSLSEFFELAKPTLKKVHSASYIKANIQNWVDEHIDRFIKVSRIFDRQDTSSKMDYCVYENGDELPFYYEDRDFFTKWYNKFVYKNQRIAPIAKHIKGIPEKLGRDKFDCVINWLAHLTFYHRSEFEWEFRRWYCYYILDQAFNDIKAMQRN